MLWAFCGFVQLRTLEGTLLTKESARFDNNSEPKSHVRLLSCQKKIIIFKDTYRQKHSFIFPVSK